jgi:hypothetical protein
VNHIRAGRLQRPDLVVAEMNAVCEGDVTTSQTDAIEIRDVSQSTLLLARAHTQSGFPTHACGPSRHALVQAPNPRQQLARATDRKPRRETVANTTARFPCHSSSSASDSSIESRSVPASARDFVAFVHHALADVARNPVSSTTLNTSRV